MEPTVSRRAFVKCASLGALAVSAAAVAGCSADSAPEKLADSSGESTSHNPSRTESCDIVVVGSGMAGICAGAFGRARYCARAEQLSGRHIDCC